MKILVPIKKVLDYAAKIKVKADGSGIETQGIKWIVNPFDEIAVEAALRLKEAGKATEINIVSIGDVETATQIRYCLAMGADNGIHVKVDSEVDSALAARILAAVYRKNQYGLVIMGKQAIDSDAGQTPQLLAAELGIPVAPYASKIEFQENALLVTREVDGGLEHLKINLPAVVSADLRLNEPRYAPLPGIMKAKKKQLEELDLNALGLAGALPLVRAKKYYAPAARKAGRKVADVTELVNVLKNEAKIIP
jgi:electron transfer flavoprotein beta subunit